MTNDIAETPLYLLHLARSGTPPTSVDVERLAQYIDFRTRTSVGADPAGRLEPSDHRGYLRTAADGEDVFVPFQLASVFPGTDTLTASAAVARAARMVEGNPICISGSVTFLGRITEVGDLDFCEYHLGAPERLSDAIEAKADAAAELPLVEIKCGTMRTHHPWKDVAVRLKSAMESGSTEGVTVPRLKLDMVSEGALGPMPTTSVVLCLGSDREAGAATESHVFQEAVIAADGPPRSLLDAEGFSRYCNWLLEDARGLVYGRVRKPAAVRAPKALKRLLSLLLAIGDVATTEEVLDGLDADHVRQVVRSGRLTELRAFAALASADVRMRIESMIDLLDGETLGETLDDDRIEEAAAITLEIGATIIDQLEVRMDALGRAA